MMTIEGRHHLSVPLVSVRIHNFNYGRYLRECLDSVVNQTYANLEISFADNASADDSWEIVLDYYQNYPQRFNLARNRRNFGPDANIENCIYPSRGRYSIQMCSDDVMAKDFIEKAVAILQGHSDCAFVMVHRGILDEESRLSVEPPFYRQSCIIPGEEQAAVYMMAAVNPSISQILYRSECELSERVDFSQVIAGRWYGARIMDFLLCSRYPVAYLSEPLLYHRLHGANDSQQAAGNLIEILGPYLLHQHFFEMAGTLELSKVTDRLQAARRKLSLLCFRYATRFLINENMDLGEQYYHLGLALYPSNRCEKTAVLLAELFADPRQREKILSQLMGEANLVERQVSYELPAGSVVLDEIRGMSTEV